MKTRYLSLAFGALLALSACRKSGLVPVNNGADSKIATASAYIPKVCIDKSLPAASQQGHVLDGVEYTGNKWPNGRVLRVQFLNGNSYLEAKVMQYAKAWEPYANVKFVQVSNKAIESDIRVGFQYHGDQGSWSYVGTDALLIPAGQQTMNFGWFDTTTPDAEFSRTATHEFGHALGLVHEQSSPVEAIQWNKSAVYAYYAGYPNYWDKTTVDNNIFLKYDKLETQYTTFDPTSIMEYPVDPSFTTNGIGIGLNYYLSATDKSFISSVYPRSVTDIDGNVYPTVIIGSQVWTALNLRVTHFANGDPIPNVTDNTQWAGRTTAALSYFANNTAYAKPYGALYNQYAINDARSICPAGWHIPTLAEWKTLGTYLGGSVVAGASLKDSAPSYWSPANFGATNDSQFTARGAGWRDHRGNFQQYKTIAWWGYHGATATDTFLPSVNLSTTAFGVILSSNEGNLAGLSIRLVKNGTLQ